MNKTSNINLSGKLFHVDEPAFEKLQAYSDRLKKCYAGTADGVDIIADVEARMSELLTMKMQKEGRTIVSTSDVDHLIAQLGEPESFEDTASAQTHSSSTESNFTAGSKRFYRNPDDAIIGGICSGLSAFLGIKDPLWIRLALVLLVFLGVGTPIFIYIILWFIVPEAKTSAQKLDMYGKPVNLASLENTVKTKWDEVGKANEGTLRNIVSYLGKSIMYFIVGCIALIFGIVMFSLGIAALSLLVAGIVAYSPINHFVLESPIQGVLPLIGFILLLGSVFAFFILLPIHLLSKTKKILTGRKITTLAVAAIAGFLFLGVGTASIAGIFDDKAKIKQAYAYPVNPTDTLHITAFPGKLDEDFNINWGFDKDDYTKIEKSGEMTKVRLNITSSPDAQMHIIQSREARAKSNTIAEKYASMISHQIIVNDNDVQIADYLTTDNKDKKFRFQQVDITLQIPQGTKFVLSEAMSDILYDYPPLQEASIIDNYDLSDVVWQMDGNTLKFVGIAEGFNHDTTLQYTIDGFDEIDELYFTGKMDVKIIQGSSYKLSTSLPEDKVDITLNGSTLQIESKNKFLSGKKLKVYIEMPMLTQISVAGNIAIDGKGFKGENLVVEATGNNDLVFNNMDYGDMQISNAGTGKLLLSGHVNTLQIQNAGTGLLDARNLVANTVDAEASGASDLWIHATNTLDASTSGASVLHYKDIPNAIINASGVSKAEKY